MTNFEREILDSRITQEIKGVSDAIVIATRMKYNLFEIIKLLPTHTELDGMILDLLVRTDALINRLIDIKEKAERMREELFKKEGEHEE